MPARLSRRGGQETKSATRGVYPIPRQAKSKDPEADAFEIRVRAETRVGEMMEQPPKATGGDARRVARGKQNPEQKITLDKAGIDKNLAKRARKMAAMHSTVLASADQGRADAVRGDYEDHLGGDASRRTL